MNNLEQQFDRWIHVLRGKASEYEHTARGEGKKISQPDLDSICNELQAFLSGLQAGRGEIKLLNK